jgi:hypothetical protein
MTAKLTAAAEERDGGRKQIGREGIRQGNKEREVRMKAGREGGREKIVGKDGWEEGTKEGKERSEGGTKEGYKR